MHPDHPFIDRFISNPSLYFDQCIRGISLPFPYQGGSPVDMFATLFGNMELTDPGLIALDEVCIKWLSDRLSDDLDYVMKYGRERYSRELTDCLHIGRRINLPKFHAHMKSNAEKYRKFLSQYVLNSAMCDPMWPLKSILMM